MNENKETKVQEQETNTASSVIYHIEKTSKRWVIFASVAFVAIAVLLAYQMGLKQESDKEWKELFNSYEYISQDGEGINNINSGEQGDLLSGAEGKVEEKSGER